MEDWILFNGQACRPVEIHDDPDILNNSNFFLRRHERHFGFMLFRY